LKSYGEGFQESTSDDFAAKYSKSQENDVDTLGSSMRKERVRPSLLGLGISSVLQGVGSCPLVTKETKDVLVAAFENGLQNEHDEQLRILNEKDIQEPELRQSVVQMRDKGYDLLSDAGKLIEPDSKTRDGWLFSGASTATVGLMRLARSV